MRKVIGYLMIASVFIGFFVFMVVSSSLLVALKTVGSTALVVGLIGGGVYLIFDGEKE